MLLIGPRRAILLAGAYRENRQAPAATSPVWKWSHSDGSNPAPNLNNTVDGVGAMPAGQAAFPISAGDLLIAIAMDRTDAGALALSGWTPILNYQNADGSPASRMAAWWKIATAAEAAGVNVAITGWSPSTNKSVNLMCFQAGTFNPAAPIYGLVGPTTPGFRTNSNVGGVDIANAADLMVAVIVGDSSDNTVPPASQAPPSLPAGFTQALASPQTYGTSSGGNPLVWAFISSPGTAGVAGVTNILTTATPFGIEQRSFSFAIAGA